jgi:hypothetical protein
VKGTLHRDNQVLNYVQFTNHVIKLVITPTVTDYRDPEYLVFSVATRCFKCQRSILPPSTGSKWVHDVTKLHWVCDTESSDYEKEKGDIVRLGYGEQEAVRNPFSGILQRERTVI